MLTLRRFLQDESGATAIEYALIAALMAVAVISAFTLLGDDIETAFGDIGDCLTSPDTCS